MKTKNNYDEYLEKQMQDPEFAALYALAKEKIKLEIYLKRLKENIHQEVDKKIVIKNLNRITYLVRHIAL